MAWQSVLPSISQQAALKEPSDPFTSTSQRCHFLSSNFGSRIRPLVQSWGSSWDRPPGRSAGSPRPRRGAAAAARRTGRAETWAPPGRAAAEEGHRRTVALARIGADLAEGEEQTVVAELLARPQVRSRPRAGDGPVLDHERSRASPSPSRRASCRRTASGSPCSSAAEEREGRRRRGRRRHRAAMDAGSGDPPAAPWPLQPATTRTVARTATRESLVGKDPGENLLMPASYHGADDGLTAPGLNELCKRGAERLVQTPARRGPIPNFV